MGEIRAVDPGFARQLRAHWPRLSVAWERYGKRTLVIPLSGAGFFRTVGADDVVEYVYLGKAAHVPSPDHHPEFDPSKPGVSFDPDSLQSWNPAFAIHEGSNNVAQLEDEYGGRYAANLSTFDRGMKPYRPHLDDVCDGRYVVREAHGGAARPTKVLDVVDDHGRVLELDRRTFTALARRLGWEDLERETEEREAAEKALAREELHDKMHEGFDQMAASAKSYGQVGYVPLVEDRRRFADQARPDAPRSETHRLADEFVAAEPAPPSVADRRRFTHLGGQP